MTPAFEFAAPRRVMFGRGRIRDAGEAIRAWGTRCLVFAGSDASRCRTLLETLDRAGMQAHILSALGEPTFDLARQQVEVARSFRPDVIVAMGGGSVIDSGKAVAMLLTNGGDPLDYAEVIGRGLAITKPSLPFVAVPTTAGAGAEATRNAVLIDPKHQAKVSLRSHLMLPELVIIDPETTIGLPASITAATGMDALAQLIEPFVSVKANPVTDALCRAGIARVARSLERACQKPDDLDAREDMSLAAWWSGMALANAGLGAVHGFAAALGGMCHAPHGLICAAMLTPVGRANITALRAMDPEHPTLMKYEEVARILTGRKNARADDGPKWISELSARLPLEKLTDYGIVALSAETIIDAAQKSSSMKGNPTALPREVLLNILHGAGKMPAPPES